MSPREWEKSDCKFNKYEDAPGLYSMVHLFFIPHSREISITEFQS